MGKLKYTIAVILVSIILVSLFSFSSKRNAARKIIKGEIQFVGKQHLLISEQNVNKLLIQKTEKHVFQAKEILDLNGIELRLIRAPHIKEAQVYVSVYGELSACVSEREPIGRIYAVEPNYIDAEGVEMPLSLNYAIRVPLVFNYIRENKAELIKLLKKIKKDAFLKNSVVGVDCLTNKDFAFRLRDTNLKVVLGGVDELDLKIRNFKAFFENARQQKILDKYKQINLGITNQVVCTKI